MDKIKKGHVILHCSELLTGEELIQAIKKYQLENYFIEKIDIRTTFDEPRFDAGNRLMIRKPNGTEYVYIFVDRAVLENADNTK